MNKKCNYCKNEEENVEYILNISTTNNSRYHISYYVYIDFVEYQQEKYEQYINMVRTKDFLDNLGNNVDGCYPIFGGTIHFIEHESGKIKGRFYFDMKCYMD